MGKIDFTMSRACLAMAAFAAVAPCPAMAQDPVFGGLVGKFDRTFEPLEFGDRSDPAQQPFLRDYAAVVVPFGDIAIGPAVNLRLGAGLEGYEDRIREIVSHLDFVRIAEPADLELTTLYEFPLTLVMFDPHLPEAAPQPPMDVELYSGWPRNFELGNLEADDFAARLEDRLRERANSKALIDLAVRSPSPFVRTCFMVDAAQPTVSGTCARGLLHGSDRAGESGAKAGFAPHILSVLNQSDKPKYVTVIAIDSENEMRLGAPPAGLLAGRFP